MMKEEHWLVFLVGVLCQGALGAVFLSSNNPTPCFGDTVNLICYYPDVNKRVNGEFIYRSFTPSWRRNGTVIFPGSDATVINQTAELLKVKINPDMFPGDPITFSCHLLLSSGGEENGSIMINPQGTAESPVHTNSVSNGNTATLTWDHTDKGPCFNNLTFSYNITWYPVAGGTPRRSKNTELGATRYIITGLTSCNMYRAEIIGFLQGHYPKVYSETAAVNFTATEVLHTCQVMASSSNLGEHVIIAISVVSVISCVAVSGSLPLVIVTLSVIMKKHCFRKHEGKQTRDSAPSDDTHSPTEVDIEIETNQSYQSVVPAVQGEGGGRVERSGDMNVVDVELEANPSYVSVVAS